MNNAERFCFGQEMLTVRGEMSGCVVSIFSDTSYVRICLFLPVVVYHILFDQLTGMLKTGNLGYLVNSDSNLVCFIF